VTTSDATKAICCIFEAVRDAAMIICADSGRVVCRITEPVRTKIAVKVRVKALDKLPVIVTTPVIVFEMKFCVLAVTTIDVGSV
jgi:hypothetical protein